MGAVIPQAQKKDKNVETIDEKKQRQQETYEEDTLDAANLALAIRREDFTKNIELRFQCEHLPRMDFASESDPLIAVYQLQQDGTQTLEGITEVIPDTLNPKFLKPFVFSYEGLTPTYNMSKDQKINLIIYDVDDFNQVENLSKHNYIGEVSFLLNDVMCPPKTILKQIIDTKSSKKKKLGNCLIRGNDLDVGGEKVLFHLGGKEFMKTHDLYIRVNCLGVERKDWVPIYSTDPVKNQKKMAITWKPFTLPLSYFATQQQANNQSNIDPERTYVKLEILEFIKGKKPDLVGEIETNVQQLLDNSGRSIPVMNQALMVGQIKLNKIELKTRITFLNYLLTGAEVSLIVGVDCSNSNKQKDNNTSLHYCNGQIESKYYDSILNLVGILQYFDTDNKIPMYGFGAKLPPNHNIVSHCFSMNGSYFAPNIAGGAENLSKIYKKCFTQLEQHGPTVFSEIIKLGRKWADSSPVTNENQQYYILLLLTDGLINDIEATIEEIVESSFSPLSIIIVGLGDDLKAFEVLKNTFDPRKDNFKLYSDRTKKYACRDIVHFFVEKDYNINMDSLARECMRKLPYQFLQYMEMKKIDPDPAKAKKNLYTATQDYMHMKIDERKKKKYRKLTSRGMQKQSDDEWLDNYKNEFKKHLSNLGYDMQSISQIIDVQGIMQPDENLFIQIKSLLKEIKKQEYLQNNQQEKVSKIRYNNRVVIPDEILKKVLIPKNPKVGQRIYKIQQTNELDLLLSKRKKDNSIIQKSFIKDIQIKPSAEVVNEQKKKKRIQEILGHDPDETLQKYDSKNDSEEMDEDFDQFNKNSQNNTISKKTKTYLPQSVVTSEQGFSNTQKNQTESNQESSNSESSKSQKEAFKDNQNQQQQPAIYVQSPQKQYENSSNSSQYKQNNFDPYATNLVLSYTPFTFINREKTPAEQEDEDFLQQQGDIQSELNSVITDKTWKKEYYMKKSAMVITKDFNEYQDNKNKCLHCHKHKINIVVIPCGHAGCWCFTEHYSDRCIICQKSVTDYMKVKIQV